MNFTGRQTSGPNRAVPEMSTDGRYRSGYIGERDRHIDGPSKRTEVTMIRGLLAALVVLLVATFPATWLLMLFLGNLGVAMSYWGTLPLGILVSVLLGSASAPTFVVRH